MTTTDDRSYYLRRAEDCRRKAAGAVDMAIRSIHEDFAQRYDRAARRAAALAS